MISPRFNILKLSKPIRQYISYSTTIDAKEMEKFQKLSQDWWDPSGSAKSLLTMNKLRVPFIRDNLINNQQVDCHYINTPNPLEGIQLLEVGCGGGILSEPLARIGAEVTGIDANEDMINLAKSHCKQSNLKINYINTSVEEHSLKNPEKYDAVITSEVIEHVNNQEDFVKTCLGCLKPKGSIFLTTINKTLLSNVFAIYMAEYVLGFVPKGTHQFDKFLEPHRLQKILEDNGCIVKVVHGMIYNPLTNNWSWWPRTDINYALHAVKT